MENFDKRLKDGTLQVAATKQSTSRGQKVTVEVAWIFQNNVVTNLTVIDNTWDATV